MSRALLAGLVAVALLLAGGLLLVARLDRQATPVPAPPVAEPRLPEPAPVLAPPAAAPPSARTPAPVAAGPAGPLPADVRERRTALQPLAAEVDRGLAALDPRVVACKLARPELALVLESLDRRVRIADVRLRVRDPGEIPEGVAPPPMEEVGAEACVRRALLDVVLDAPSARPGRRWDMAYMPGGR